MGQPTPEGKTEPEGMPELTPFQMWLLGAARADELMEGMVFAIRLSEAQGHIDSREVSEKLVLARMEHGAELDRLGRIYLQPRR